MAAAWPPSQKRRPSRRRGTTMTSDPASPQLDLPRLRRLEEVPMDLQPHHSIRGLLLALAFESASFGLAQDVSRPESVARLPRAAARADLVSQPRYLPENDHAIPKLL